MNIIEQNISIIEDLESYGSLPDEDLDIVEIAFQISRLERTDLSLDRYCNHIKKLIHKTGEAYKTRIKKGENESVSTQLDALKDVMISQNDYKGDDDDYDNLDNADLTRVIDRRKGLPVALCILYIHVARAQGWSADGLNVPGHFVMRLDHAGQRLIIDPFHGCKILDAPELRALIKERVGKHAELSSDFYIPATNREVLIRLVNNTKLRHIKAEEYEEALLAVEAMRAVAPNEYRFLFDAGILYARIGEHFSAIDILEHYIQKAPHDKDRHEAALLLQQIRHTIN